MNQDQYNLTSAGILTALQKINQIHIPIRF
jgi:hypothetical protein